MTVEVLDLSDAQLPDMLSAERPPPVTAISPRLAAADAFVVVTPEYNHSFPAPLKTLIDWHTQEWRAKPVGFVSLGGLAGGLRAVEHLRQVFAELHAVTVRDTVSFHMAWTQFDSDGPPNDGEGTTRAAHVMLDQLAWWAEAVRDARARRPYGVAAREAAA
jgi:NAD(P)H-dependent FMN reductase